MMVQQNKWRATRFGNRATLVDTYTYEVASAQQMVERLAELLRPTAADLHCESYLNHCVEMAQSPSAAQRQLDIRAATDDPREVVRQLTEAARVSGQRRQPAGEVVAQEVDAAVRRLAHGLKSGTPIDWPYCITSCSGVPS